MMVAELYGGFYGFNKSFVGASVVGAFKPCRASCRVVSSIGFGRWGTGLTAVADLGTWSIDGRQESRKATYYRHG